MDGHKLYIALRLMSKGSAADVMHYGWPGGMEEEVVRCILCQALRGLKSVLLHLAQPTFTDPSRYTAISTSTASFIVMSRRLTCLSTMTELSYLEISVLPLTSPTKHLTNQAPLARNPGGQPHRLL